MSYGITWVLCIPCGKVRSMYGWMPFALEMWQRDEGLECCGYQTEIINQREGRGDEEE